MSSKLYDDGEIVLKTRYAGEAEGMQRQLFSKDRDVIEKPIKDMILLLQKLESLAAKKYLELGYGLNLEFHNCQSGPQCPHHGYPGGATWIRFETEDEKSARLERDKERRPG